MITPTVKVCARSRDESADIVEFELNRDILCALSDEFARLLSSSPETIDIICHPDIFRWFADYFRDDDDPGELSDICFLTYDIADKLAKQEQPSRNELGLSYAEFCDKYFNEVRHNPILSCVYAKLEHNPEIFRAFLDLGIIHDDPQCLYEFVTEVKTYYGSRIFEWIPQKYIERLLRYNAYADREFPHISWTMTVEDMYYFVTSDNFIGVNDNIRPIMKLFVEKCIDGTANIPHGGAGRIAKKIINA